MAETVESLQAQLEEREKEIIELQEEYEKEIKDLEGKVAKLEKTVKEHEATIADKEEEATELLAEFDREIAGKDAEIEELQARVATAGGEAAGGGAGGASAEDVARLEKELEEADAALEKASALAEELRKEVAAGKQQIATLEKEKETLAASSSGKDAELADRLQAVEKEWREKVSALETQRDKLILEAKEAQLAEEKLQTSILRLEKDVDEARKSSGGSEELMNKIKALELQLQQADDALMAVKKELEANKIASAREIAELTKDLETADKALEKSQADLKQTQEKLTAAASSSSSSSSSASAAVDAKELADLKEELAKAKVEIKTLNRDLTAAKKSSSSSAGGGEKTAVSSDVIQARVAARRAELTGDEGITPAELELARNLQRKQVEMIEKQKALKECFSTCSIVLTQLVRKPDSKIGEVNGELQHLVQVMRAGVEVLDAKVKTADGSSLLGDLGNIFAPKRPLSEAVTAKLEKLRPIVTQGLQALLQLADGTAEEGWTLLKTDLKIEITTLVREEEEDAMPIARGQATVNAPPDVVFAIINKFDAAVKWDPRGTKFIKLLEELDEGVDLVHMAKSFNSMVVSDRDFCLVHYARMLTGQPQLTFVKMIQSVEDARCPADGDMERAVCHPSGFVVRASRDNPKVSNVTFIQHMDLKGFLPSVIADTLISDAPLCIAKIRMMVTTARK